MRSSRGRRWAAASGAGILLCAAFLLPARRPLPFDLCPLHHFTGIPCLTCGLTRSVCLFAQGEWSASLSMHPAGWLVLAILTCSFIRLLLEAVAGRDVGRSAWSAPTPAMAVAVGFALSIAGWGARLAGLLPPV